MKQQLRAYEYAAYDGFTSIVDYSGINEGDDYQFENVYKEDILNANGTTVEGGKIWDGDESMDLDDYDLEEKEIARYAQYRIMLLKNPEKATNFELKYFQIQQLETA